MWKTTGEIAKDYGASRTTILRWLEDGDRQKVGSANEISDGTLVVDRDINGARGIFLRVATR